MGTFTCSRIDQPRRRRGCQPSRPDPLGAASKSGLDREGGKGENRSAMFTQFHRLVVRARPT